MITVKNLYNDSLEKTLLSDTCFREFVRFWAARIWSDRSVQCVILIGFRLMLKPST